MRFLIWRLSWPTVMYEATRLWSFRVHRCIINQATNVERNTQVNFPSQGSNTHLLCVVGKEVGFESNGPCGTTFVQYFGISSLSIFDEGLVWYLSLILPGLFQLCYLVPHCVITGALPHAPPSTMTYANKNSVYSLAQRLRCDLDSLY